ncbi:sulfur relay protein TusC [Pseudomonas saudimassiliensis]|uniref:Sulfur relay protein TusC n=1 Tax=Pseudomonas saudimassiliensis TaxID=1461581 RepID=A0A078MIC0_9PSED|nr:sulfurtransferase complex subunit TusC [Pseudomonas saudimassiliensis]CEA05117.1 sulfur relay protein TusC [Pseudomonas saudimassiliensis]CEF26957.1 sulfur relay protein TusC [Pseudomonas saudimassiliensis]
MKSLLIISRHAPTRAAAREALDVALAAAAFGVPCGLLFMDDGVLQLIRGQDSSQIKLKSLAANLQALPLFGVEDVLVCQHSLGERGLQTNQCLPEARPVSTAEIATLVDHYDQILSL